MSQALFRFYAELNDFLPRARRQVAFAHTFAGRSSVKDRIEALGVPHTEVDLILVNGVSVDFAYILQDGDQVSVYPVFEAFDIVLEMKCIGNGEHELKVVAEAIGPVNSKSVEIRLA